MLRRILNWVLWCVAVLVFILIMGATALWLMPRAVSTEWAKKNIEARVSGALYAPVTLERLHWTWEGGIRIEGLRIADHEAFSRDPILSIGRLILDIDPRQLMARRLCLDLQVEGLRAHLVRDAEGRTNLETWWARLEPTGKAAEETQPVEPQDWRDMALALPGDLIARVRIQEGSISVDDRQTGRSIAIRDIALLVDIPSLASKPVTIALSAKQEMDGNPLPPMELSLSVENLVDPTPAVRISTASIKAQCRLPGLDLAVSGALSDMGIQAKMDLDLEALMAAAAPLVPPSFPALSGRMAFEAQACLDSRNEIAYEMTLSGSRLSVEGGPLKERRIGPVAVHFSQTGSAAPEKRELMIEKGELRLQDKTRFQWEGRVRRAGRSSAEADVCLKAIAVDLKEVAGLVGPFLPVSITSEWPPERPQSMAVEEVHVNGILPDGAFRAAAKGLTVELPSLNLIRGTNGLSAEGVSLRASEAAVQIKEGFATSLEASAELDIRSLGLSGNQTARLDGLKISNVRVTAQDLIRSTKALLGMRGTVNLTESVAIDQLEVSGLASVSDLHHKLKASVLMQDHAPWLKVSANTGMTSPALRIDSLSKRPIKGGIRLEAGVDGLDIAALTPLSADVAEMSAVVRVGDIIDVHLKGAADALGAKRLKMKGEAKIDLEAAITLIPPAMKPKGTFAGLLELHWRLEGRKPTTDEVKTVSDQSLSLTRRLNVLGFVDLASLRASFKKMKLHMPMKKGSSLSVHDIRTVSPLTIALSKGLKSVRLEGDLAIGRISELPGFPAFKPPLQATLALKVHQEDLSSLDISETLRIDPLNIEQNLQASVNRLGRLLNSTEQPTLATLVRHLDLSVAAGLRTTLGPSLAPLTPGLFLNGPLEAGLGIDLKAGEEISARISLESGGIDVTSPQAHIQGLASRVHLSRTYALQFEGEGEVGREVASAPLSRKVLRPSGASGPQSLIGDALTRRLVEDLGGPLSGPPSISFEAVHLKGGPFPLALRHGEIQLGWADALPSIDRFQWDVMGGSMLGDFRITRQDDLCRLEMKGAFSGLDAATLLPEQAPANRPSPGAQDRDTQVSGQVSLQIPVSQDSVRVMNHLSASIHLTHIGSRTLERLLYAMDPYEANEGIVKQRAILRKGTPEWVDLQVRHGNLALTGSVAALGTRIPLPRVERLNLTSLPIHQRLHQVLGRVGPLENGLKALSSQAIMINKDSTLRFVDQR